MNDRISKIIIIYIVQETCQLIVKYMYPKVIINRLNFQIV